MFLALRCKLINWLTGEDITVIVNTIVYDYVLDANTVLGKRCLYKRNKIINLEDQINKEVACRINLDKQGILKQGNAFILK